MKGDEHPATQGVRQPLPLSVACNTRDFLRSSSARFLFSLMTRDVARPSCNSSCKRGFCSFSSSWRTQFARCCFDVCFSCVRLQTRKISLNVVCRCRRRSDLLSTKSSITDGLVMPLSSHSLTRSCTDDVTAGFCVRLGSPALPCFRL